ncbi:odorant receptor 82a [Halyomorpha halys]|uniref:odorant receptor 82a n=1 Tax=Halyomorpha halys TaxID=286706 RepID=UPI0006D4EE1C|nr:odorant receptor 24a [Halyomorpha halys]XP_014288393.1 odorant receptor 24a [Halyomorpha halys]KAE8574042.1 Odorant receptor 67 [Halyomorpha halys]
MQYQQPLRGPDVIDGLSIWYLKLFGFWKIINDFRTTGKRNLFFKFEFIMSILISFPYIACQFSSYLTIDVDIQKATLINFYCLPAVTMCSRILVFWFHADSQCRLFNLIKKDFLCIPENKKAETRKIYRRVSKSCNMMCMFAFVLDLSVVFTTVGIPGIPVDYILYHTGSMFDVTTGRKKILCAWYPLPMAEYPYYEIIFVYEMMCVLLGGIYLPIYASLFYQVAVALHAQFLVLGYHVSTLKINPNIKQKKKNMSSGITEDLYKILLDHQKLLSYADELRSVYNPLVTINLGGAIGILIVSVFQSHMGETRDIVFVLKSILYAASIMIELLMFCYSSSLIQAASSDLHFAIYSSDWYKADTKFRNTAQMMMVRAKKGVNLTAIRMYPVNLETLMSIFQFAYSTSALMSGMLEE